ncbi:hypothetical protein CC79DRAFT_1398905 [Sarocladium strictum]
MANPKVGSPDESPRQGDTAEREAASRKEAIIAAEREEAARREATRAAELFRYVDSSRNHEETFQCLGFEFLHRLNIVRLQNEIIALREEIYRDRCQGYDKDKLSRLLHEYTRAIEDYNYIHSAKRIDPSMTEVRKQRLKSSFPSITTSYLHTRPFESHYYYLHDNARQPSTDPFRDILKRWLPPYLSYSSHERQFRSREFEEGKPPAEVSPLVDNVVRLIVALVAVGALVAPMCIMTLNPSSVKSLITSSVFMILFASALSFGVKTTNVETLVATATYSAVLVVFVGTNSSPAAS